MINLRELYGERYWVGHDGAVDSMKCPWHHEIHGKFGCVYIHGADTLGVCVDGHKNVVAALVKLGLRMVQNGDDEKTFVFGLDQFDAVAALVKLRKRMQVSEEDRARRQAGANRARACKKP